MLIFFINIIGKFSGQGLVYLKRGLRYSVILMFFLMTRFFILPRPPPHRKNKKKKKEKKKNKKKKKRKKKKKKKKEFMQGVQVIKVQKKINKKNFFS